MRCTDPEHSLRAFSCVLPPFVFFCFFFPTTFVFFFTFFFVLQNVEYVTDLL